MARFNIMSKDGQSVRFKGAPKYNGIFGKPSYLEFAEIASPTPIAWEVGDYVDYTRTGLRYKLYSIPQVAKSATNGKAGDAFVYKNVQFFCATKDLEIALFRDLVEYDNTIHFSSIPNVDTYEDVYGIASRIQANMDDFAPGAWNIQVFTTTDADVLTELRTVRQFSVSDGTCLDALNQIYNLWHGIGWIYSYESDTHTITIGRPNVQNAGNTTSEFSYGNGNGLKVISRAVSSKNEMATRVYAYGSDRNMPTRYYNNLSPGIKDAESVYIPHLMLPLTDWGTTSSKKDARLAYLQNSDAVAAYGLIPKVLRFDGSNGLEDIYPSIEGMTVGSVADQDFPSTGWNSSDRIDEVYSAENPSDDGQYTESSEKIKQSVTRDITDPNKTYATVAGQEAVTIANDSALFTTSSSMSAGKYVINMGELGGSIVATDGDFAEVPKGFLEIYIGSNLETSKEIKVVAGYTRIENEYLFSVPNATFTTEHSGIVKAFIRFEAKIPKSASVMSIAYNLGATTATINVEYSIASTFVISVPQLGFDLNTVGTSTDGLATISMTSGKCAGRDFVVKKAEYNTTTHTWDLTCQRQDDTSLMLYFPNSVYTIENGDRFVLLDIQMPSKFVTAAMTRLHNAASIALSRLCKPRMVYTPEVDSKEVYMSEIPLMEGLYMPVYDTDLISVTGNTEWVLIDSVTIAENDDAIPIWSVTLRDEKAESMLASLTRELADAKGRLRDWDADDSRKPAKDDVEAVLIPTVVGVQIQSDRNFFAYTGDNTPQTIVLTAVTSGINNPTYQWYYLGESDWVALSGETAQTYSVLNNSQIYYQNGEIVEDFKVIVTDGSDSWSDQIQVTKLTGSVTIALSNPVHLFAGEVETAVDNQSDSTTVVAYVGDSLAVATVNSISGAVTGMTASVRANTNNTTAPIIDIAVTDALTTPNGALTVNVTAGGVTRSLSYAWAVAFKGEGSGSAGMSVTVVNLYKRSATAPSINFETTLTYSFTDKELQIPEGFVETYGWSPEIPPHNGNPLYITATTAASRANTDDIEYTEWATPVKLVEDGSEGEHGVNTATIMLFQRAAEQPSKPIGTARYTFLTGTLVMVTGSLGDWQRGVPSGDDPCWVTQATALSTNAYDDIYSYDEQNSEWSDVEKYVEDGADGLPGTNGSTIYTAMVYKASNTKPSTPTGTTVPPTGWSLDIPEGSATIVNASYESGKFTGTPKHLNTITHSESIWGKVSFSASAGDTIRVVVTASSEANYDYGYVSLLDNESHSTTSYRAKISGTESATVDFTIPSTGTHFFCVGYVKDSSQSTGDDTIYVNSITSVSNPVIWFSTTVVTNNVGSGIWTPPQKMTGTDGVDGQDGTDGSDGYSHATIYMYRRFPSGIPTNYPIGNTTYKFSTSVLSANSGQTLNGWTPTTPSGDGPIYVTMVNVSANVDEVFITGGWTSGVGDWTPPVRWTGEDGTGMPGKIMRGVNEYSTYGLGTSSNPINYQGRSDTDSSHIYYDVILYNDTYYYCEHEKSENNTYARLVTPGTDSYVWVEAQNFDFVATRVLLADDAFIDVMSGNGVYMYGNYGASNGQIVAGMQGGSRTLYNGSYVSQINFFAGDSDAQTAPFRVDYEGNLFATKGYLGPYEIGEDGLYRQRVVTRAGSIAITQTGQYEMEQMQLTSAYSGITFRATVNPNEITMYRSGSTIYSGEASITPTLISVTSAQGDDADITRDGESVITSYDGNILRIRKMTQSAYDNLSVKDSYTFYVIVSS